MSAPSHRVPIAQPSLRSNQTSHRSLRLCLVGFTCLLALASHAAEGLTTALQAQKRVLTKDAQGKTTDTWVNFTKLLPGDEVTYTVVCANAGSAPASGVVVQLPIPPEMTVTIDASPGGADITYSVDGGLTFSSFDTLRVTAPEGASRPANAADVVAVRWKLTTDIAPGGQSAVSCRAHLK